MGDEKKDRKSSKQCRMVQKFVSVRALLHVIMASYVEEKNVDDSYRSI